MDEEPQIPPRPSETSVEQSKKLFDSKSWYDEVIEMWDFVPPLTEMPKNKPSHIKDIHNLPFNLNRQNILYDFSQQKTSKDSLNDQRSNLFKKKLSASTEQISSDRFKNHLIDLNSSFDQNGNNNTKDKIMDELIKTAQRKLNTNGRRNSLNTNILSNSNGFNFRLNPLYYNSNQIFNNNNNNQYHHYENNNIAVNENKYANLYWPMVASTSQLVPSPLSPIANPFSVLNPSPRHQMHHFNPLEEEMNQQLINKIKNSKKNQENNITKLSPDNSNNVLIPTSVYKSSVEDPKQIIDLFDPLVEKIPLKTDLSQNEPKYVNDVLLDGFNKKEDIVNNNDRPDGRQTSNDYTDSKLNSIFECFKVEPRDNYNKELDEFCEHLKSLYMTYFANKSSSSCNINSGLVYSPRIDIDYERRTKDLNESDKLYLYGITNLNESLNSADLNRIVSSITNKDENLIIIDVRFHSLVYSKITGQMPNQSNIVSCVKMLDSNYNWFSMKFPVDFDENVDMIVSHVLYNVAESEDQKVNIKDFILKLNRENEFLQFDTPLSSYVHIQNCKKNSKHIILELIDQTSPDFWQPFLRCESDTKKILNDFKYVQIMPQQFVKNFHGFSVEQLNVLIDELNLAYSSFLSTFNDIYYLKQNKNLFNAILEKITSLCKFLSHIETNDLTEAIEKFKSCYQHVETYTGANHELNIDQIRKRFEDSFVIVIQIFIDIIRMYSETFPVDFKLPRTHDKIQKAISFDDDDQNDNKFTLKRRKKMDISQTMSLFTLYIDVCTQIPDKWSHTFADFSIVVNLFHGFNLIKSKITERSKMQNTINKKFRRLVFNHTLNFDIPIYILPRETRIEFILIRTRSVSNKLEVDALATTFFYLYDIDEILLNGSHLLPWNEIEPSYMFPVISSEFDYETKTTIMREMLENNYLVSYNLDPNAMMLVINVAPNLTNNVDYCFPEIKNREEVPISLQFVIPFEDNMNSSIVEDPLYGFHGCNPNRLNSNVIKILQKNPIEQLTSNERDLIWKERQTIKEYPGSILKIMKSPPSWSCHDLPSIYGLLQELDSGPFVRIFRTKIEALQLLSMDYPDKLIRRTVVKWLNSVSVDELCDYLPQLVQSLRFETSIDSYLIWSLFEFSLMSARFCHYFYWQLKSCLGDRTFSTRCQIYMNSLLILCGERTREQFLEQDTICEQFSKISAEIKQVSKDFRSNLLRQRLEKINENLKLNPTSLPLSPSLFVNGLETSKCSYFNSNSLPLKLIFNGAPPYRIKSDNSKLCSIYENRDCWHRIIFKCGDDLRKDMLVMQIISIINRVWLRSGLNLRLITFGVLNTSDRTGMIEIVRQANTLREIQLEYGLTGNFKHHTIATWLKRHNTNEFDYKMAIENFIHSCAGYVVITYLLGICDRHNDNIMVTTSGNLFHIDFGKFFGDAQMMAGIKRDRVPFVFTADMAFVINEGGRPSKNYQFFVDLCCRCFILVRQNGDFLLSLMAMMIRSGIDYLSPETIKYFHKALMPNLIESQAKVEFNRLIEKALGSFSTQLNFFIHSIAQTFSGSGNGSSIQDDRQSTSSNYLCSFPSMESTTTESTNNFLNISEYDDLPSMENDLCNFSFTKCRFTEAMDGHITQLEIVNFRFFVPEKNEKTYFYKVKVDRRNYPENFVYRSFKEFIELHEKLSKTFPLVKFYTLKRSPILNRSSRHEIASQRTREIQIFLKNLLTMASEISHSDIVYTFFHPILRDQRFIDAESIQYNSSLSMNPASGSNVQSTPVFKRQPKIKLNISFRDDELHILVLHVRNLDNDRVTAPDSYVKLYLRSSGDNNKSTKKKTRVMPKNAHPTFMESFIYMSTWEQLMDKNLEVSVWESDMTGNKRLGQVEIPLDQIENLYAKNERWFDLK